MDIFENARTSRYTLSSRVLGDLIIQKPEGWRNDNRSLEREKKSRAITEKIEVDLTFYGNGADYISTIFRAYGISEKILLKKEEKNRYTKEEKWGVVYVQQLELKDYKEISKTGGVSIKATEGGLFEDVQDRAKDKYNLIDTFSADKEDIGELKTHPFQPKERKIFIESLLQGERFDYPIQTGRWSNAIVYRGRPIPVEVVYNSNVGDVITPTQGDSQHDTRESPVNDPFAGSNVAVGMPFFFDADEDKVLQIKMEATFKIDSVDNLHIDGDYVWVEYIRSEKINNEQIWKEKEKLMLTATQGGATVNELADASNHIGIEYSVSFDREVSLLKGESLSFVITTESAIDKPVFSSTQGYSDVYFNITKAKVNVIDATEYPPTVSRCIKPIDLFDRLVAKMTGKVGLVRSSIFEAGGEYEHFVVDNGFWARGFPDTYLDDKDEEQTIQFNTSFQEAFDAFNYIEPLFYGVEVENGKQVLRIEKATHTMQDFIGIRLGSVDEIEHEASGADFFSKVELGQKDDLEYEEINGLDEPNGLSEFTSYLKSGDTYSVQCDYNIDAMRYELTRRKPFINFPKEDTKGDKNIWIHDCKLATRYIIFQFFPFQVYTHKLWADDFDAPPKGIFDPESAWNLRLSPMNRLIYGHGYSIKRGLYHFKDKLINFASSNANQNLITYKDGRELKENGSVAIKDLGRNKVQAEKTSLTFKMTQPIEKQFHGYTDVDGKLVPNYFGLIEYIEKGQLSYGRLVKLSGNEKSKLTLINAQI